MYNLVKRNILRYVKDIKRKYFVLNYSNGLLKLSTSTILVDLCFMCGLCFLYITCEPLNLFRNFLPACLYSKSSTSRDS